MLQFNYGDHRPLYEQIKEKMKEMIISESFAENEKIPSVRELAGEIAINPNTIQKAYKELEAEGYIYSQKAKGYFVMPMKKTIKSMKSTDKLEELENILMELKYLETKRNKIEEIVDKIYGRKVND